jgi:hypothetical protein
MDLRRGSPDDWRAMPKKAGPKRINPDTFFPVIFTPLGTTKSILVCHRRWIRGPDVLGGLPGAIVSESTSFLVAIELGEVPLVLFNLTDSELVWQRTPPEEHGISARCAKLALAEAWHAVNAKMDLATLSIHTIYSPISWATHKKGMRMRNIFVFMAWDRWNRENLSMNDRAATLASFGIIWTGRQIAKFASEHGLAKNSA